MRNGARYHAELLVLQTLGMTPKCMTGTEDASELEQE